MGTTDGDRTDRYSAGRRTAREGDARPLPVGVIAAAVVVGLVLLVGVLVMARSVGRDAAETAASEPVTAVSLPSPGADSDECRALVDALPESLGDARRVAFAEPAPPAAAAYRMPDAEPVVVRCGLPDPPTFTVGSALQEVNGVQWFNEADPDPAVTATTWVAVDRGQYVAVTLPEASGTGPIQALSDALTATLEPVEPRPAPVG